MFRLWAVLVFGTALVLNLFGQETTVRISGRVVNATGVGIPGTAVILTIPEPNRRVTAVQTDPDGKFAFPSLPAQLYEVSFDTFGYYVATRQVKNGTLGGDVDIGIVHAWADPTKADADHGDPEAVAQSPKRIELHDHCAFDVLQSQSICLVTLDGDGIDSPAHPRGKEFAFWLQPDGKYRYLVPMNGARLMVAHPGPAGENGCRTVQYSDDKVRIDSGASGTTICLRTKNGTYAQLEVTVGNRAVRPH